MGHSYQELVTMLGQAKADVVWLSSGREIPVKKSDQPPSERKKKQLTSNKEYSKLTEYEHGKLFHSWLDEIGYKHTHIGNESGQSGSANIVVMMAKKKASGVSKGYPDYEILVPWYTTGDGTTYNVQLAIELKKAKGPNGGLNGSHISEEQVAWMTDIRRSLGRFAAFCHGFEEAKAYVTEFKKRIDGFDSFEALIEFWTFSMDTDIASFPKPSEPGKRTSVRHAKKSS